MSGRSSCCTDHPQPDPRLTRSLTRDTESSLGDLTADAQLAATADAGDGAAVLALMNSGGVRADLTYPSSTASEGDGSVRFLHLGVSHGLTYAFTAYLGKHTPVTGPTPNRVTPLL